MPNINYEIFGEEKTNEEDEIEQYQVKRKNDIHFNNTCCVTNTNHRYFRKIYRQS